MGFDLDNTNSQNRQAPKNLHIARGDWNDLSHINKFGYNSALSTAYETVWDGGAIYAYPGSALAMTLTSAGGGTDNGVQVNVEGLDTNYDQVNQTVTLAGSGTATTTTEFLRVFRAYIVGSQAPTGNITIANGGTTYAQITLGNNQTLMAVYTVPRNKRAYIIKFQGSVGKDKQAIFRGMARPFGGVFQNKGQWITSSGPVEYEYPVPLKFDQKTDFEIRCKADATTEGGAIFDIILEEHRY
jgi:hypothetical protein